MSNPEVENHVPQLRTVLVSRGEYSDYGMAGIFRTRLTDAEVVAAFGTFSEAAGAVQRALYDEHWKLRPEPQHNPATGSWQTQREAYFRERQAWVAERYEPEMRRLALANGLEPVDYTEVHLDS